MAIVRPGDFDAPALFEAMDARRTSRGMSWKDVMLEMNSMAHVLNANLEQAGVSNHPIVLSTVTNMAKRKDTTCQHGAAMLRWLGASPEQFMPGAGERSRQLPKMGPDKRPRWDLPALAAALDKERGERGLTWQELAKQIPCGVSQVTGLKKVRYAISMVLAMRIMRWLDRPAADFIKPAEW